MSITFINFVEIRFRNDEKHNEERIVAGHDVQLIDGFAFRDVELNLGFIEAGNNILYVGQEFLIENGDRTLRYNFSSSLHIEIIEMIDILG
jgi:hypothetical protein